MLRELVFRNAFEVETIVVFVVFVVLALAGKNIFLAATCNDVGTEVETGGTASAARG